jgi:hypothetical protein
MGPFQGGNEIRAMPIQHALGKVGARPAPLTLGKLASEQALEDMIVRERAGRKPCPSSSSSRRC